MKKQKKAENTIYGVIHENLDGISYIDLYYSKSDAKTECRSANKKLCFDNYSLKPLLVNGEPSGSEKIFGVIAATSDGMHYVELFFAEIDAKESCLILNKEYDEYSVTDFHVTLKK